MYKFKMSVILVLFLSCCSVTCAETAQNQKQAEITEDPQKSDQNCSPCFKETPSTQEDRNDQTSAMQNSLKNVGDQLDKFSSLYVGRLDQKLTSLASDVSSIDSNVKNIQERAHVWDTFQLHVSAWNEQIKSLDRKVDIINSGQERIGLLENKLSVLLNLEYNSQRTLNKVSSIEERLDKLDLVLTRLGSAEARLDQQFASRGILATLKQMERKFEKSLEAIQRNGNMRNRFVTERRISNGTVIRRNLIIKCPTPLVLEDLVKDMASKVDLIYDKLAVDNTSGEEEKKGETVDEIEDIDHDYSLEMYQNDHPEETKKVKDDLERSEALKNRTKNKFTWSLKDMPLKNHTKTKSKFARHNNKRLKKDIKTNLDVLNLKIEELSKQLEGMEQNDTERNGNKTSFEGSMNGINIVKKFIEINEIEGVIILNGTENIFKSIDEKIMLMHNDLRCGLGYFMTKFKGTDDADLTPYVKDFWYVNATDKSGFKFNCDGLGGDKTASKTDSDDEQKGRNKFEEDKHLVVVINSEEETKDSNNKKKDGFERTVDNNSKNRTENSENILETEEYLKHCQVFSETRSDIFSEEAISVQYFSCKLIEALLRGLDKLEVCSLPNSRHFCSKTGDLIFQRRTSGSVDFARTWADYKWGFGDAASGNYWLGNLLLSLVSSPSASTSVELRIGLEDFDNEMAWAEYDNFEVSPESQAFALRINGYRGNATDSLSYHSGVGFSTRDRRHDQAPACCPCSDSYGGGGWWFNSCFESNLNGQYRDVSTSPELGAISWEHWRPEGSLRRTAMSLKITQLQESHTPTVEDP